MMFSSPFESQSADAPAGRLCAIWCLCGYRMRAELHDLGETRNCSHCKRPIFIGGERLEFIPSAEAKELPHLGDWSVDGHELTTFRPGIYLFSTFAVEEVLGQGGMGTVYKVRNVDWDMVLAMKVPRSKVFREIQGVIDFERECETWIELGDFPYIVSCRLVRRMEGLPLVFAQYIDGHSLQYVIRSRQIYKGPEWRVLRRIMDIAIQMAWGLEYAHRNGVVHQDVKSANVLVTHKRRTLVTDFGLARARRSAEERRQGERESSLVSCGGMTPAYCSPEQFSGKKLSHKTDIWSWALTVLEMFTGKVTWGNGILGRGVLRSVAGRSGEAQQAEGGLTLPALPEELGELLARCLTNQPEGRPESFYAIAERLIQIYESTQGAAYPRGDPFASGRQEESDVLRSLNNRAISYAELGHADRSRAMLRGATELLEQHGDLLAATERAAILYNYCLLEVLFFGGETVEKLLRQYLEVAPAREHAFHLALLLLNSGRLPEAEKLFVHDVQVGPRAPVDVLHAWAVALLLNRETLPAIHSLQAALRKNPGRCGLLRTLAIAYYYDRSYASAALVIRELADLTIFGCEDAVLAASIMSAAGRRKEAEFWIGRAQAQHPTGSAAILGIAELVQGNALFLPGTSRLPGNADEAEESVRHVRDAEPTNLRASIDCLSPAIRRTFRIPTEQARIEPSRLEAAGPPTWGGVLASGCPLFKGGNRWGASHLLGVNEALTEFNVQTLNAVRAAVPYVLPVLAFLCILASLTSLLGQSTRIEVQINRALPWYGKLMAPMDGFANALLNPGRPIAPAETRTFAATLGEWQRLYSQNTLNLGTGWLSFVWTGGLCLCVMLLAKDAKRLLWVFPGAFLVLVSAQQLSFAFSWYCHYMTPVESASLAKAHALELGRLETIAALLRHASAPAGAFTLVGFLLAWIGFLALAVTTRALSGLACFVLRTKSLPNPLTLIPAAWALGHRPSVWRLCVAPLRTLVWHVGSRGKLFTAHLKQAARVSWVDRWDRSRYLLLQTAVVMAVGIFTLYSMANTGEGSPFTIRAPALAQEALRPSALWSFFLPLTLHCGFVLLLATLALDVALALQLCIGLFWGAWTGGTLSVVLHNWLAQWAAGVKRPLLELGDTPIEADMVARGLPSVLLWLVIFAFGFFSYKAVKGLSYNVVRVHKPDFGQWDAMSVLDTLNVRKPTINWRFLSFGE